MQKAQRARWGIGEMIGRIPVLSCSSYVNALARCRNFAANASKYFGFCTRLIGPSHESWYPMESQWMALVQLSI